MLRKTVGEMRISRTLKIYDISFRVPYSMVVSRPIISLETPMNKVKSRLLSSLKPSPYSRAIHRFYNKAFNFAGEFAHRTERNGCCPELGIFFGLPCCVVQKYAAIDPSIRRGQENFIGTKLASFIFTALSIR